MFRSLIVVLLLASAGSAFARGGLNAPMGPCIYDSKLFCGAPALMGNNKKPVPCLVTHLDHLTKECRATVQSAMSPKPS
jgi:hypothetical protein